jgi:hypothetical protein
MRLTADPSGILALIVSRCTHREATRDERPFAEPGGTGCQDRLLDRILDACRPRLVCRGLEGRCSCPIRVEADWEELADFGDRAEGLVQLLQRVHGESTKSGGDWSLV